MSSTISRTRFTYYFIMKCDYKPANIVNIFDQKVAQIITQSHERPTFCAPT